MMRSLKLELMKNRGGEKGKKDKRQTPKTAVSCFCFQRKDTKVLPNKGKNPDLLYDIFYISSLTFPRYGFPLPIV